MRSIPAVDGEGVLRVRIQIPAHEAQQDGWTGRACESSAESTRCSGRAERPESPERPEAPSLIVGENGDGEQQTSNGGNHEERNV